MAKRKRLTPAQDGQFDDPLKSPVRRPLTAPPIAHVVGDVAAEAALAEVGAELASARAENRLIEAVALDEIDDRYLIRDRIDMDEEELASLMASLRNRGQQMPVELVSLSSGSKTKRFGLVSGWRRLTALRRLLETTGDERFATIRAVIVTPDTAQDTYVAMVEENEIRVNLSFYERARIAHQSVQAGIFPDQRAALQGLFGTATRSRRSKIGSFMALVEAFDAVLKYPARISEKLGLSLVRELNGSSDFATFCVEKLNQFPDRSAEQEVRLLSQCIAEAQPKASRGSTRETSETRKVQRQNLGDGLDFTYNQAAQRVEIIGPAVDETLVEDLQEWLKARL